MHASCWQDYTTKYVVISSENTRFPCFVVCSIATFRGVLKFDPKFDYIHQLHIGPTILNFIDILIITPHNNL